MKKILVLLVMFCMVFLFTANASAESKIYFDYMTSGTFRVEDVIYGTNSSDLTATRLGGEFFMEKIKLGIDYTMGQSEGTSDLLELDHTILNLKGGFRLVDTDTFTMDAMGSIFNSSSKSSQGKVEFNGTLLGLEGTANFTDKIFIDGYWNFSLAASAKSGGSSWPGDVSIYNFGAKFNYLFNKNIAFALGYHSNTAELTYSGFSFYQYDLNGFTLGVQSKF